MVPDREREVAVICNAYPEAFAPGDAHDATRLALLREVIIPALVAIDGPDWGYLTKTDQRLPDGSFKIPCDIVIWRPTRETVDCLTKVGACWIVREPPPPQWVWTAVAKPPAPAPSPDASVPVLYGIFTWNGTLVPQADGFVVLINPLGEVASLQPDGSFEWRPPGTVGAYELARRVGANLLRYDGTGSVYDLAVQDR